MSMNVEKILSYCSHRLYDEKTCKIYNTKESEVEFLAKKSLIHTQCNIETPLSSQNHSFLVFEEDTMKFI